jgi:hypothetical protein
MPESDKPTYNPIIFLNLLALTLTPNYVEARGGFVLLLANIRALTTILSVKSQVEV